MSEINREFPYRVLGERLRRVRERFQESLADASGAVEIELDDLNRIEQGLERPPEDVLLLLISHFALKEDEASRLWELAEYDKQELPVASAAMEQSETAAAGVEARINYTDMAQVTVNRYGVVLNFMQASGPASQPMTVARVGMSREHAASVLEILRTALAVAGQSTMRLPAKGSGQQNSKKRER